MIDELKWISCLTECGTGSVFRTLDLLTRLAILRPTFLLGRAPVYVLMSAEGHHAHIVCPRCRQEQQQDKR